MELLSLIWGVVLLVVADVGLLGMLVSVEVVDADREVVGGASWLSPVQAVVSAAALTTAIKASRRITGAPRPPVVVTHRR